MADLKHCPFCGGEATMMMSTDNGARMRPAYGKAISSYDRITFTSYCVRCQRCQTRTKTYKYKERAFTAWNRRAEDAVD